MQPGVRPLLVGGVLLVAVWGAGCAKDRAGSRADTAGLMASGGVRADSGAAPMRVSDYPLTRKRVDDWRGAQRALSTVPDDPAFVRVRVDDEVSEAEVDRAVAYLESRPESRRAIEQSGLSIRDFVLTALALERAERSRALAANFTGRPLPPGNLALAGEFANDLRGARASSGLHIVDYDDDSDGDDDRAGRVKGRDDDRGDSDRGDSHRGRGKHKGKGKNKH
ncbi:MAG TPA: hypothetical protein VM033_04335 [Gemmatimonadaceae bacterium]|nr:hypothetical protein [Gemmatimonadaceae bacterium]